MNSSDLTVDPHCGSLHLILGPMFSGKTQRLVAKMQTVMFAKRSVLAIKFKGDARYADDYTLASKSGVQQAATSAADLQSVKKLSDVQMGSQTHVFIDEGQNYPDLSEKVIQWVEKECRHVYISALDGTSEKKHFPGNQISALIPHADTVIKLRAVCMRCCKRRAPFTMNASQTTVFSIGGQNAGYEAVCRLCHRMPPMPLSVPDAATAPAATAPAATAPAATATPTATAPPAATAAAPPAATPTAPPTQRLKKPANDAAAIVRAFARTPWSESDLDTPVSCVYMRG